MVSPYNRIINPEAIHTNSKLTNYNMAILEVLMWQASNSSVAEENEAVAQAQADSIYNSMTSSEQEIATLNRQRLLRGEHQDHGETTSN